MENGIRGIAVISGEGVKEYYEKRGYSEQETFMIKSFFLFEFLFFYLKNLLFSLLYIF